MKLNITPIISLALPLWMPLSGSGAELGTRLTGAPGNEADLLWF